MAAYRARAANDASSKGIYKGVVIGSSGTLTINIANGGATITGIMVIDGITVNLTSAVAWVAGQPYVADFTGTMSGSAVVIHFSVGVNGNTPIATSTTWVMTGGKTCPPSCRKRLWPLS